MKGTDACLGSDPTLSHRGTPKVRYAMVQLRAGTIGPLDRPVRVLVIQDDVNLLSCENANLTRQSEQELRTYWSGPAADTNLSSGKGNLR